MMKSLWFPIFICAALLLFLVSYALFERQASQDAAEWKRVKDEIAAQTWQNATQQRDLRRPKSKRGTE